PALCVGCGHCFDPMSGEPATPRVEPPPVRRYAAPPDPIAPPVDAGSDLPERLAGAPPAVRAGLLGAAVGVGVGGFLAVVLSQYWPVFGGLLERSLAEPWSPARRGLIPVHVFVFALVGIVLGGGIGVLLAQLGTPRR